MTDGLLESIIQLEKSIQAEVAAEQARAEEWLQRERDTLQNALKANRLAEEERYRQELARKKADLQREADALEAASTAWCQRLSRLAEERLRDVLKRHLAVILPGGDHDHPHGQG